MNPFSKLLFSIFAISLILSSCTVEKRHYQSGFHVDWHRSAKKPSNKEEPLSAQQTTLHVSPEENAVEAKHPEPAETSAIFDNISTSTHDEVLALKKPEKTAQAKVSEKVSHQHTEIHQSSSWKQLLKKEILKKKKKKSKNKGWNKMALLSFGAGVLSITLLIVGTILLIILVDIVSAISNGSIALRQLKKHSKMKGKGFAVAGICLGIVSLALVALILFAL